jgi:competence protein ComFB
LSKKLKKDFDRDKMYSKIMPTFTKEDGYEEDAEREPILPATPEPQVREAAEPEKLRLHNYMQDILLEKLPHTMKVLRSCQCERCRLDILAIAMNSLPTAYAVTAEEEDSLERIKKLRRDYEVMVTATLIKAIQQVKNEPRH